MTNPDDPILLALTPGEFKIVRAALFALGAKYMDGFPKDFNRDDFRRVQMIMDTIADRDDIGPI